MSAREYDPQRAGTWGDFLMALTVETDPAAAPFAPDEDLGARLAHLARKATGSDPRAVLETVDEFRDRLAQTVAQRDRDTLWRLVEPLGVTCPMAAALHLVNTGKSLETLCAKTAGPHRAAMTLVASGTQRTEAGPEKARPLDRALRAVGIGRPRAGAPLSNPGKSGRESKDE